MATQGGNVYYSNSQRMAARMLSDDGDPDCLDTSLLDELDKMEHMLLRVGATLRSRQAVAVAIVNWQARNPDKEAYVKPKKESEKGS